MAHFRLFETDLTCECPDRVARATGHAEGEAVLVVHAGSTAHGDGLRDERMLKCGVVERLERGFRFSVDFPFVSAASAAQFILGGRQPNGFKCWKNGAGQTLLEMHAAAGLDYLTH